MQLVIDFIFYLYVYSTCFERQALIIMSPLTVHTASFIYLVQFSPPPGFDPQIVQSVASRYTVYVIPAHK
jgi:hypothetical protein